MATQNYYKLLGINDSADVDTIKKAFRVKAKEFTDGSDPAAKALKKAYEILTDPVKRAEYNKSLTQQEALNTATQGPSSGGGYQMWEYLSLESSRNYGVTKYYVNGEQQPTLKNAKFGYVLNLFGGQGWELVGIASDSGNQTLHL